MENGMALLEQVLGYTKDYLEGVKDLPAWPSEEAVKRWRNALEHRMSQKEGREKLFESYQITVCSVVRSYTDTDRAEAPDDSNEYMGV